MDLSLLSVLMVNKLVFCSASRLDKRRSHYVSVCARLAVCDSVSCDVKLWIEANTSVLFGFLLSQIERHQLAL